MLSKGKKLAKTPQPAKGKGGVSALKAPKSAPQLSKSKKKLVEKAGDDDEIKAMLESLKTKGKKIAEQEPLLGKGGSEESEDDDDFMTPEDGDDDDDDDDDSAVSDDLDDEDGDDDEEDDDEDDDDEEEGSDLEESIKTATQAQLQKNKKPGSDVGKKPATKGKNNAKKSANKTGMGALIQEELAADSKRREERDRRTLFVKHLSATVTEKSLKSLSSDIEEVRLDSKVQRSGEMGHRGFAFLGFKDEKTAEKNFHSLQGKECEKRKILVDFVGAKSKHREEHEKMRRLKPEDIDATKLYVTGFDKDMTSEKLTKLFPKAYNVTLPIRGKDKTPTGYGFVHFATEEEAREAHDNIQDKITAGHRLTVLFAKKSRENQKRRKNRKTKGTKAEPKQKKAKVEEEDKDDDDESGDDDDDDEESS